MKPHYNPQIVEKKWYEYWLDNKYFVSKSNSTKEPYTVVMPPPNITGILHMGHVLNNTIQDVLVRKARMQGKETCWVPGIDHASIATEARVVAMLKERNINKHSLTREAFLDYVWQWKKQYGGIILEQLKQLGVSCDWDRLKFTMDEDLYESVQDVFIELYNRGYIYRGERMIYWDPQSKTALSNDEVIYTETESMLYFINYGLLNSTDFITIATTRPETIFGDTAICINPNDFRYAHLKGLHAIVPIIERVIPIIEDEYVDVEFGTGCLKVTPAHDMKDYELGVKHSLTVLNILNEDGSLNEESKYYVGQDRFIARKKVVQQLKDLGFLVKTEKITSNIGFSERTNAIVEPRLSTQWFVKTQELAKPALEHVLDGTIKFHPNKFQNLYKVWMEQIQDWCISRQLWWGHRIPAYYLSDGTMAVAKTKQEALKKIQLFTGNLALTENDLQQDEDVLDTWFSAWLWPITVFDGIRNPANDEIKYFYPTNDLVTAPEIIFFWVARMIMAGYAFQKQPPFKNVYFTGIVRDKQRKKMSKSLGNSPDPIDLIKQYGADAVRMGMLLSSSAGNDLLFDVKLCEQGRNFANKIWNAFILIKGFKVNKLGKNHDAAIEWFESKLHKTKKEVAQHFDNFRLSQALVCIYKLVWDDFCSCYLEMIKPIKETTMSLITYDATVCFFEELIKLLHPFMPFITEELWHEINDKPINDCIAVAKWSDPISYNDDLLYNAAKCFELIAAIRNLKINAKTKTNQPLELYCVCDSLPKWLLQLQYYVLKLAHISKIDTIVQGLQNASSCNIDGVSFYLLIKSEINVDAKKKELETEITYALEFLTTVEQKLSSKDFVDKAPVHILDKEKKKKTDILIKIENLKKQIDSLEIL